MQSRQLASAAPLPEAYDRDDKYSSVAYGTNTLFSDPTVPPAPADISDISLTSPPWDFSDLLHFDTTTVKNPQRLKARVTGSDELRGNSVEIERNFEACLLLKNWHRAEAALHQLRTLFRLDPESLRLQFNRMLAHRVDDFVESPTPEGEQRITQWIEKDMKQAGLHPDAYTFALVIKATLSSSTPSKRDRTVRRYWDMARRYNLQSEVGSLRNILSERDLGTISEICPLEADQFKDLDSYIDEPLIDVSADVLSQKAGLDIKETEQKGMGMSALRKTLALFSDVDDKTHLLLEQDMESKMQHARERQKRLESDAIESAVSRWKIEHEKMSKMGIPGSLSHGRLGALLWQWHEIMTAKITAELKKVHASELAPRKSNHDKIRLEYGPFMALLKPEKLAAVTVISLVQIMSRFGSSKPIKLVQLVTDLGKGIENEHEADQIQKRRLGNTAKGRLADHLDQSFQAASRPPLSTRTSHHASRRFQYQSEWNTGIHAKLGSILCEMMFDAAKIPVTKLDKRSGKKMTIVHPAFMRKRMFQHGKHISAVTLHEAFVELLSRVPAADAIAKQLPMVCAPRPWTGWKDGGYLETDLPVLRVKNGERLQRDYIVAAAARGDLDMVFAGLDVLGSTAWKINSNVFEVMVKAWNRGEEIANLSPLNKSFDLPKRPPPEATRKEKYDWYQQLRAVENEKTGMHSNRCFQNFQMEIAKSYLGETFYLPHNLDFRGRAYPIPPYLNQMGADNCRGLMLFAKGRELGQAGLRWLQIHLANVYGFDKASLDERAQFPLDHIDDVRDSVTNPLDGRKWWLKAEDPWQCLATCFELVAALDSPDPTGYVSYLPIHQDGSCNGLQHYAALGGDLAGAKQVNLEPGAKPADVYSGVADLVRAEIAEDAASGHETAKILDGRITRKIVKQTVMTNVYGVTFMGAIRQVRKQIDDLHPDLEKRQISGTCSAYVARKIFKALGSLFTGAHEIQYWLGDCANRITASLSPAQLAEVAQQQSGGTAIKGKAKTKKPGRPSKKEDLLDPSSFRSSVVWTTPLNLPVVQPYRENKGQTIRTSLQSLALIEPSVADGVSRRKQLQAFPPNFIHSLDATHMQLSALKAHEHGLTFASVHDSFWTHAADVDTLSSLLREAFIRMHSEDIVGRLEAEFRTRYSGHLYLAQIWTNSPLGKALRQYREEMRGEGILPSGVSQKAVRAQKHAELLREIKKAQLMRSEDTKDREEGQAMVTAATLYEQLGGEECIYSQDSLGATAMGSVPDPSPDTELVARDESTPIPDKGLEASMDDTDTVTRVSEDGGEEDQIDDPAVDVDVDDLETESSQPLDTEGLGARGPRRKRRSVLPKSTFAWLPLSFRPVPQKGEFDVKRLRDSLYFFS